VPTLRRADLYLQRVRPTPRVGRLALGREPREPREPREDRQGRHEARPVQAAAVSIAITSSGAFRKFETTVVITQKDLLTALEKAADVAYVAPGAAVHA